MSDKGLTQSSDDKKSESTSSKSKPTSRQSALPEDERFVGNRSKESSSSSTSKTPQQAKPVAPQPKILAVHTVKSGDTLSHMALEYYGSATREKWMQIYEANKEQLGEYPGLIRPGDKINIPELADSE